MEQNTVVTRFLDRVRKDALRESMDGDIETPLGFWGNEAEEILAQHFPLHKACRDGDLMAFSCLVSNAKYEQLFVEDQFYSWTPIHWAAYFGKVFKCDIVHVSVAVAFAIKCNVLLAI